MVWLFEPEKGLNRDVWWVGWWKTQQQQTQQLHNNTASNSGEVTVTLKSQTISEKIDASTQDIENKLDEPTSWTI